MVAFRRGAVGKGVCSRVDCIRHDCRLTLKADGLDGLQLHLDLDQSHLGFFAAQVVKIEFTRVSEKCL